MTERRMRTARAIRQHPVGSFILIVFLLSYGGFLLIVAPQLASGQTMQPEMALLLFPVIVVGVGVAGLVWTALLDGRAGISQLVNRLRPGHIAPLWYAGALFGPPILFLSVLLALRSVVSADFTPHVSPIGMIFGVTAGLFEEVGWTGYLFPRMSVRRSPLTASLQLGLLWGLWHAPVVDYLGAAAPHGSYWLAFFAAFVALATALRVLIGFVYVNTGSVLLAMIIHASNTGFLATLAPSAISPPEETLSYGVYAAVLWLIVGLIVRMMGVHLTVPRAPEHMRAAYQ